MLLKDCITDFDRVVMRPFERTAPEEEWVAARDGGIVPEPLFDLYRRANYLSFGSGPPFLQDSDNILFSYFSLILRSLMESLQDVGVQLRAFTASQNLTYDIGKKMRGEPWDETADARARRQFRDLLIAAQTSLDSFADLIAIFWPGQIKNLSVGRAQFSRIEKWLNDPFPAPSGIVISPTTFYLQQMHQALLPLVNVAAPEADWLPFMRLLRNKAAHLGQPLFREVGLHDNTGHFYVFIPREWPYIWEKHIKLVKTSVSKPASELIEEGFIHQDIISFAEGLQSKIMQLIRSGTSVLNEAFEQFKNFPFNQLALLQLEKNSEKYAFENFLQP